MDEEWRAFRHDTEAGRLLARLYGNANNNNTKPKISYPILKTKSGTNRNQPLHHGARWRSVGPPNTRDPTEKRYDRVKAASVPVPRFDRNKFKPGTLPSAVDRMPHRRSQKLCSNDVTNGRENRAAYRPPRQGAIYSEAEKKKLSEINTYRGGKILPTDLTHPIAPLPSEIQKSQREEAVPSSHPPTLFDQILDEIHERRAWQSKMESAGFGAQSRQKIVDEISARAKELHRIDKARAQQVLKGSAT